MKTTWYKKINGNTFLILGLISVTILPISYVYLLRPEKGFWDNAMSNMFATILALIAGIPVALWIDRLVKSRDIRQQAINEIQHEKEILQLIKEELDFSYNSLFLRGKKGNKDSLKIQPLKSDLWEALLLSSEAKYIKNPNLLNRITSAYYVLKLVKNIEDQAYIALRTSAIVFTEPDGTKSNAAQKLLKNARSLDNLFEESIKAALQMIEERLLEIKNL